MEHGRAELPHPVASRWRKRAIPGDDRSTLTRAAASEWMRARPVSNRTRPLWTICERGVGPCVDDRNPRPMQAHGGWRVRRLVLVHTASEVVAAEGTRRLLHSSRSRSVDLRSSSSSGANVVGTSAETPPFMGEGLCSGEGIRTVVHRSKPALRPVNALWAVPAELIGREEERASIGGFLERSEHAPTALVLSGELRRRSSTSPRAPASDPKAEPAPAA
jgi:hypothetical protein